MTWEELLKRGDIVGGDLETQEGKDLYRGPIKSIRQDGKFVFFTLEWVATMRPGETVWHKSARENGEISVNTKKVTLQRCGQTRDGWFLILTGLGAIFPKGEDKLDPAEVRGLNQQPIAQA